MNIKNLNTIASEYDDVHSNWKNLQGLVRLNEFNNFIKYANDSKNVVELGLGDGVFTEMLTNYFKKVIAVDGSSIVIKQLKGILKEKNNVEYILSYVENLKLDGKIDNIVMSHLLEHLEKPVESLRHLKSFMNNNTVLYISVPNSMSLHRQVAVKMGLLKQVDELNETDNKLGHYRVYSPELLKKHVIDAGLKIIKFGGSMIKPLTNAQIEKHWDKEMIKGFIALGDDYPELCGDIYIIATKE